MIKTAFIFATSLPRIRGAQLAFVSVLLSSFIFLAQAPAAQRELSQTWKVEVGQSKKQEIKFFQAESVQLTETFTQNGSPVDLSGTNTVVVWEINGWSDYTNTYAISTGEVSVASNVATFALTPEQSNLSPGTYLGFVRALKSVSNELVQVAVLAYQTIAVEWSPAGQNYNLATPLPAPPAYGYTNNTVWFMSSASSRIINDSWKVEVGQSKKQAIKFFQAESVRLDQRFTRNGIPLDFSDTNTVVVWEINGWTDYTNTYAIVVASPVNATNGLMRFDLSPAQANLTPGTYKGFIRSLVSDGTNLQQNCVLAYQTIDVEWSPDSRNYNLVGPLTYPAVYDAETLDAISNALSQSVADLQETKLDAAVFTQAVAQATAVITQMVGSVEGQISTLQTNPPAAGPVGSLQYNSDGHLAGFTNLYFDPAVGKIAGRFNENVFRLYNGITNAADAAESNLIFRLSNQAGISQIEMGDDGDIGLLLRGDGYGQFKSLNLSGTTRTNWMELDPVAMPAISNLVSGADAFETIQLDTPISSWSDIGLTYSNAVRINNPISVTNDSAWTGWTTTGSLTAQNEILLTPGQYLLSSVQSNGVGLVEVSLNQSGMDYGQTVLVGTNEISYPYYGTDARLKIIAGNPLPGATPQLYVSKVVLRGYDNAADASAVKYVASLRRTDAESHADDMTSVRYVNAAQAAAEKHADSSIAAYAADPDKTVVCDRIAVGNYVLVGDGAWQGVNVTQSGDRATFGTRFDEDIFTLESGLTTVELQSLSEAGNIVTLDLYAQNITGDITIGMRPSLVTGVWTNVTATITDLGSGNYTAEIDISTFGTTGFFRAYAETSPASAGAFIINAEMLNMDGNRIEGVSEIVFTNGWKIACTTNGLGFISP